MTQIAQPYPAGDETCRTVIPLPPATDTRICPFMPTTCGKYEQHRNACSASVVVTNHHNFLGGHFPLGVMLDGWLVGDLSVAELVLRRSHVVLIDEIDHFQSTALEMCASELVWIPGATTLSRCAILTTTRTGPPRKAARERDL